MYKYTLELHAPKPQLPLGFGGLALSRILASLIALKLVYSLGRRAFIPNTEYHILSQARTLLHSWKTPIPRRILSFLCPSRKMHCIWCHLNHADHFHHFPEFTMMGNSELLTREEWTAVNKHQIFQGLCKLSVPADWLSPAAFHDLQAHKATISLFWGEGTHLFAEGCTCLQVQQWRWCKSTCSKLQRKQVRAVTGLGKRKAKLESKVWQYAGVPLS